MFGLLSSGIFAIEIEHCLCRSAVIFCKFEGQGEWISSRQSVYGSGLRGVRDCYHGDLDVLLKNLCVGGCLVFMDDRKVDNRITQ